MNTITDHLRHNMLLVKCRSENSRCTMRECRHRIKEMRHMIRTKRKRFIRGIIIAACMSNRNMNLRRKLLNKFLCAFRLRCDRNQLHQSMCSVLQTIEHRNIRTLNICRILRALLLHRDKWSFKVNAAKSGSFRLVRSWMPDRWR